MTVKTEGEIFKTSANYWRKKRREKVCKKICRITRRLTITVLLKLGLERLTLQREIEKNSK
jgi:hypothetical protein